MALFSVAGLETFKQVEFRERSRQLDELLRGDFRSIEQEVKDRFPNSRDIREHYLPFVSRFAQELTAGLYSRRVQRVFTGKGVTQPQYQKLRDVYDASGFDRFMLDVHRSLLVQNTVLVAVMPMTPDKVKLLHFAPWQFNIEHADPIFADDIQAASKVELRVPVQSVKDGQATVYGSMILTPDLCYIEDGGKKRGVYREDLKNPFGFIPVVALRTQSPLPGRFEAPLNESILNMAVTMCLQESDNQAILHHQSWGQKVITGGHAGTVMEEVSVGPDKILVLNHSGLPDAPSPDLKIVQGNPPLSQITNWMESRLRLLCSMFDLSAENFLKHNTSTTATARASARHDRQQAIERVRPVLEQAEQDLVRLISGVLNQMGAVQVPKTVAVEVTFNNYEPSVDLLHEAQATDMRVKMGLISPVQLVAEAENLTRAQAISKIKQNLADLEEVGLSLVDEQQTETTQDQEDKEVPGLELPSDVITTLNGAQIQSAQGIIEAVAEGKLPRSTAKEMLIQFLGIEPGIAERILGPIGKGFKPTQPEPAPAPAQGAQNV